MNAYHADASACLVVDGKLVAAIEEERCRRLKHWSGFPASAIRYCLAEAGVSLGDVDYVAINQDSRAHWWRKVAYAMVHRPSWRLVLDRIRNRQKRLSVSAQLARLADGPFRAKLIPVEHHLAHLASAHLVSGMDESVAVSVDGFGDFASAAWGRGSGTSLAVDGNVFFPHSLGIFYEAITRHLGFQGYGDEYKVMGLAPYGSASFMREMRQLVLLETDGGFRLGLDYFVHHRQTGGHAWGEGEPSTGQLAAASIEQLLGPARSPADELTARHRDIARSAQAMYEEAFFHLLRHLHDAYRLPNLSLAGGCAMNSVANGKVTRETPFRRLYVQAAAGDAGGAIGAAYSAWHRLSGSVERFRMEHAYLGPRFEPKAIARSLDDRAEEIRKNGCRVTVVPDQESLCRFVAEALAEGKVVGWFQGRMEWGARALGNRSILGDPRRADMRDLLNRKIKRRESFRPFAPSILRESVSEWFEVDEDVPFMSEVHPLRAEKLGMVPAVTHVDGSGRLQTVTREANPRFHCLLEHFRAVTGVPMLLNTSFNENEPIVCRPDEALDCFLRTHMDLLVIDDHLVERVQPE